MFVSWHPCANNILLSAGADTKIIVWNVETKEEIAKADLPDLPQSVAWNYNGSQILCSCKDKKIRVFDARTGDAVQVRE